MADHLVFGLRLRTATPLPGIPEVAAAGDADVVIALGERPAWADAPRTQQYASEAELGDVPAVVGWSLPSAAALALDYAEGIRFHVTTDGRQVWSDWDAPLTVADAMTFLIGPVLGYALRRRGLLALHASCARFGDVAVAFVGPGGAGKSTLVTACAQAGHAIITDDILVVREIDGRWWTTPAPDQVRLWEDSERMLFGGAALPALTPNWPKRGLGAAAAGLPVETGAVPLGLVLLLEAREADDAPRVEPVAGGEALLSMVVHSYANYLLDASERAAELRAVGRLAARAPVRRLVPHADAGRLPETVGRIAHIVTSLVGTF